jgi:hypothetical protein
MLLFGQAIVSTKLSLARTCPATSRRQIVPSSRKLVGVACRICGAQIPPPNDHMIESDRYVKDQRRDRRETAERRWRFW